MVRGDILKKPQQVNERYNKRKLVYVILGTTIGVYLGFQYILPLVVPFIFAYFIAKAIQPAVMFLHKHFKIPHIFGGAISITVIFCTIGTGVYYLLVTLLNQIRMAIQNIPIYQQLIASNLDAICCQCDSILGLMDGDSKNFVDFNMNGMVDKVKNDIMPMMTKQTFRIFLNLVGIIGILFIIIISVLMIIKDMTELKEKYESSIFYQQIHPITHALCGLGFAYLRAQLIIISIIAVVFTVGLFFMGNPYALLVGVGIALFDAFPVLGSGSILIPWSIFELVQGNIYAAAILMTLYLCCQLVRQILEPKLIGDKIGIKPIFTIMAMYIGLRLFGIIGVFLGPVAFVTIVTIVKQIQQQAQKQSEEKIQEQN